MWFYFFYQAQSLKIGNDARSGVKAIKSLVAIGCRVVYGRVIGKDIDDGKVVAFTYFIVVEVMRWRNFYATRSKLLINVVVSNNWNAAVAQG